EFPIIKPDYISKIVYRWHSLHPEIPMEKGALGIADLKKWTEEELEQLRKKDYRVYCKVMKKLGKIPKAKKDLPTNEFFYQLKEGLTLSELKTYSSNQAFLDSCLINFSLFDKVSQKFPDLNRKKTKRQILELKKIINKLGKDRPPSSVVGTAIYLANAHINQEIASDIMSEFGKCSITTMSQLCKLLKLKKNN
ncbi:MAG: hypothetical protein ACW99L_10335, partial [Promethearchaeota archaeon]